MNDSVKCLFCGKPTSLYNCYVPVCIACSDAIDAGIIQPQPATKIDPVDVARQVAEALSRQGIPALAVEPSSDTACRS
jgi:hypothetical protein